MHVTQIAIGRFHHFQLARQMHARSLLHAIWTGYPPSALRDEKDIDTRLIHSFSRFMIAERMLPKVPILNRSKAIARALGWAHLEGLDRAAARSIDRPTILVALSSAGLHSGRQAKKIGGRYVCDRGSSHIGYQRDLLTEEYRRWKIEPPQFDDRVLAKELKEYQEADCITVPSTFVRDSFIERGTSADKIRLIPYGGRLDRFSPVGTPDAEWFTILFVGGISVRKGIPYLLKAFAQLKHPKKRLRIIGTPEPQMEQLLATLPQEHVELLGQVPNTQLAHHYSTADVMVLPSIEEGFGMVMGEALACGCPVISTRNSGAPELFDDGVEGRILPIRDIPALSDALTAIADASADDRAATRARARARIARIGGWDSYGEHWARLVTDLSVAP